MHVQILHADPLCLLCLSGIVVGNVWNISVRYAKSASSFGRNLNLTAEVKEGKFTCLFFFSLLHFWLFIYEGQPGCVTATCAAYAACTNTLVPNRKFLRWNSIAVIQGSLQTAWSDLKSFWAAEISHVNFDLPIWPSLDDFPCTVKRWVNITQVVLFSIRHLSFCNHLNTGICPNKLQMLYSSKQKLF